MKKNDPESSKGRKVVSDTTNACSTHASGTKEEAKKRFLALAKKCGALPISTMAYGNNWKKYSKK